MHNFNCEWEQALPRCIIAERNQAKKARCEQETEKLFFWIMFKMVKEIHYKNNKKGRYSLILEDKYNRLLCNEDYYFTRFVIGEEYYSVLKNIVELFNKMEGYTAIYCRGKQTKIKIYLKVN